MIIKKSREYYQRKASINKKANQSTAYKIQVYNNNRVDELVKRYNEGEAYTGTPESVLYAELAILNKPEVYKHYNHIIHSKFTSNDNIDNLNVKNKANRELDRIVSAEVERVSKNLQYVEQVLRKYTIPQKQYEEFKAKQEQSSIANRQQILKEVAVKANDLLLSDGLNIPNTYTYRNIETTAENLLRQSQMGSKHEEILAINNNYLNQGKDEIYTGKEWIWTGRGETTRHRSNHLQKRQLKEPFVIVNDKTLHIDELMYPCDPAGSFSNAFICYCEVQYLTGDARDYQNLGSLSLTDTKFKVNAPALKTPKFMGAKQFKKQFKNLNHLSDARAKELHVLEIAEYYGAKFTGNLIDKGVRYSVFEQEVTDKHGYKNTFKTYIETDIITKKTYDKIPISQVLNEVYKVPETLRAETRQIWFKDSEDIIVDTDESGNYVQMERTNFGNNYRSLPDKNSLKGYDDANHRIIINSNFFKSRDDVNLPYYVEEDVVDLHNHWKHTTYHEFIHSGDRSRDLWQNDEGSAHSESEEYKLIHNAEPDFTPYGNTKISESMAEHGGYISCMEANPSLQKMTIKIKIKEKFEGMEYYTVKYINYGDYKKLYPKHYKYFIRKIYNEGF